MFVHGTHVWTEQSSHASIIYISQSAKINDIFRKIVNIFSLTKMYSQYFHSTNKNTQ